MIAKKPGKGLTSLVLVGLFLPLSPLHLVPIKTSLAIELNSINDIINNFTNSLPDEIKDIVPAHSINGSINNAGNIISSNASNMTSSQIVVSKIININGSIISNQVINKNGVCSSYIVGGPGNDTISSNGVCDDQLIGGLGADKLICGQGTDIVRDFNSEEGDIIVDPQNCEKIL
jgi:hypothetical protein